MQTATFARKEDSEFLVQKIIPHHANMTLRQSYSGFTRFFRLCRRYLVNEKCAMQKKKKCVYTRGEALSSVVSYKL